MSDQTEPRGRPALLTRKLKDTSGAAIALVALSMVALLSAVALAVDVGMMVTARTEAQRLGDAAALAGAIELRDTNGDSAAAHNTAASFGSNNNTVRGDNVAIQNGDVDVIPDEWTVRVRVNRTSDRNNALPTFFARIFGVDEVDIRTESAAWAVASSTIGEDEDTSCPALPLALLPKFEDTGDPGWQDEPTEPWTIEDNGKVLRLKQKPNAGPEPAPVVNSIDYCTESSQSSSWQCWWRFEDEDPNTQNVESKILGDDCSDPVSMGDEVFNAAGGMQSQVHQTFQSLIENDPNNLQWCDDCTGQTTPIEGRDIGCAVSAADPTTCFVGESRRLRTVPVVDPPTINGTGSGINAEVTGFVGVFVDKVAETFAGNEQVNGKMNVYLRIVTQGGSGSGVNDGEDDPNAFVRTVQLIE